MLVVGVLVLAMVAADVPAISGTRTIEPGLAFGNVLLITGGIIDAVAVVPHESGTVTGAEMFVDVVATDVAAILLHVSCTGTAESGKKC